MHLALIPGHGWRPSKVAGRGPLRDPGAVGQVVEADVVRALASAVLALAPDRVSVHDAPGPAGPGLLYRERHAAALAAIGAQPGLIVHLHANAAERPGDYPLALYDPRSSRGRGQAAAWAGAIDAARRTAPNLRGLTACQVRPATRPTWDRAANLLEPTWSAPARVSSVLLEMGFVNQPRHAELWAEEGLRALARTIGQL